MTRAQLKLEVYHLVRDWPKVEKIFELFGKLTPEPNSGNIRDEIPNYNKHLIKKVGRQKINFTVEQQNATRAMLRKMGLI
jgi:hypothetical protein